MQDGVDVDDVERAIGRAERNHHLGDPGFALVALVLRLHVLVVLDVVEQHQVRPVRAVAQAAHLLAHAEGLQLAPIGGDDHAHIPHPANAAGLRVVHRQTRIGFQLNLN